MQELKYPNGEGNTFKINARSFDEWHGITLCCISLNEEAIVKKFLNYYRPYVDSICMVDGGSIDKTVELAAPLVDHLVIRKFDGHYSNQANRAIEMARTDWILLIDFDEFLEKEALVKMRELIDQEEYDCYAFPRKEIIDNQFKKLVYPDFQERLYRSYCRRVRPIHGEVVGYHKKKELPKEDGWNILHEKNSKRHKLRNTGYAAFEINFAHEISSPGSQKKDSFEKKFPNLIPGEAIKKYE